MAGGSTQGWPTHSWTLSPVRHSGPSASRSSRTAATAAGSITPGAGGWPPRNPRYIGVSVAPTPKEFTRIPFGRSARAQAWVRPLSAHFDAS